MIEITNQRTQRNKIFQGDDGSITEVATLGVLHYESLLDSGIYDSEINCTPIPVNNAQLDGWLITANAWHYALGKPGDKTTDGWVGFGGRHGAHWFKFRLARVGYLHWPTKDWDDVGGVPTYDRANLSNTIRSRELVLGFSANTGSVAEWEHLWTTPTDGDFSVHWRVTGNQLKEDIVVNQAAREWLTTNRPPTTPTTETWFGFVFQIDVSDIPKIYRESVLQNMDTDWDATEQSVILRDVSDRLLAFLPVDYVHAGEGKDRQRLVLRKRFWKDAGNNYLLVGARVDQLNALPAGDLVFDPTVNPQPAADDDIVLTYPTSQIDTTNKIWIGNDGDWNHNGLRYTLNIVKDATVSDAFLRFTANDNLTTDTVRIKISYEDTNDPGDFSGDSYANFEARTRSATNADWDFTTDWTTDSTYDTSDISTVIQALLAEAYWATGEHCVIFVEDDGSDTGAIRTAYGNTGEDADWPYLYVTYASPTTTSTTTTTSTSTSTSTSTTSTSTSTTTSTSTSSTTTLNPANGALAFGEQNPTSGETAISWATWSDGAGGAVTVSGDADWGKLQLSLNENGHSDVYDFGNSNNRVYEITRNVYGSGQESATLQVRGDTSIFTQDAVSPEWANYTVPTSQNWRYIQIREAK